MAPGSSFRYRPPMLRWSRALVLVVFAVLVAASCTSSNTARRETGPETGGTLRVGLVTQQSNISGWCPFLLCGQPFDPQSASFVDVFQIDRCCFMRTLLSYNGTSVAQGGTVPRPDMATSLPTVSADRLTWTFRLRSGVRYAPPFDHTEIVAADFIRSLERAFTPAGPAVPWADGDVIGGYWADTYLANVIAGVHEFTAGKTDHVAGLQAPDPHTLVIHLTRAVGDLPYRLALPQFGPIPANPDRPDDPLGVAQGHDFDYGDVIVSSGPYMFEGSEKLTFAAPPQEQLPPVGNGFASATLVRNPSWSRASDPLRHAYADRIEFYPVDTPAQGERLVRSGALDVVLNAGADVPTTKRWLHEPNLRDRIRVVPLDGERFLFVNLAMPPFDDLQVRRAMNLVVDRQATARTMVEGKSDYGHQILTHLALDSYEDNLLLSYAPPGMTPTGDVRATRKEMRRSRYDRDVDGRCDAPVCKGITLVAHKQTPYAVAGARAVASRLEKIGILVRVQALDDDPFFSIYGDPSRHVALLMDNWVKDFPNASTFFPVLLRGENIGTTNQSMVGASTGQLKRYGYAVRSVPDVDSRIAACESRVFGAQTRCWAQLDQYMSEEVVPWIPLTQTVLGWLTSARVRGFAVDASIGVPIPALDNIQLRGPSPALPPAAPTAGPTPPMPDAMYRTRVSAADIVRFGGTREQREDVGAYMVVLRGGRFLWHQFGDEPIFNPVQVGTYRGDSSTMRFSVDEPPYNAVDFSPLSWRLDGEALVFSLSRCTGPAAHDPAFCAFQRALFTAHPWERVTSAS